MGKWYYLWNETRDVYQDMGKKGLQDLQNDILAVWKLGWNLNEVWSIVNNEDHEVDPQKIVKTDR